MTRRIVSDPLEQRRIEQGLALHRQNRFDEAEILYRQVLAANPAAADALYLLGVVAMQGKRLDEALQHTRAALRLIPGQAPYHFSLGNIYKARGEPGAAQAAYRAALTVRPDFSEAYLALGNLAIDRQDFAQAGRDYRAALELRPGDPDALMNLGTVYAAGGRFGEAIAQYERALAVRPGFAEAECNLGLALKKQGQTDEALAHVRRAIELKPDYPEALNNLGNLLGARYRHGEAIDLYRRALILHPTYADAHYNLANSLTEWCDLDAAIAHFRACSSLDPARQDAVCNLLFTLNYHPGIAPDAVFSEYRRWGEQQTGGGDRPNHLNAPEPERKLKIGYVSPDFNGHVCHYFVEPLLELHRRDDFVLYAYSASSRKDEVSARMARAVEHWRDCADLSDGEMADLIRRDGIDILVDLAGHTRGNRLPVFARKPAPVQMTWLGYGTTTGLTAIDYYLTDEWMAPAGETVLLSEQPWRLPRAAFCYRPPEQAPPVSPLPASINGGLAFGTLSRTVRLNHRAIALWARILLAVPDSRLVIDQRVMSDPATRKVFAERFAACGIPAQRLTLACTAPHWNAYHGIDIALDPFPHNAGTTTLEALWMGVPVISMADRPPLGRLGATLLHAAGLDDWLAQSEDEYLAIAVRAASDRQALGDLRATLRARLQASPLRDEQGFVATVESALRAMWRRWCAQASGEKRPGLADLLRAAMQQHNAGNLGAAQALYLRMLAIDPGQTDALNLLGIVAYSTGDFAQAEAYASQAVALDPGYPPYRLNLGNALAAQGRHEKARDLLADLVRRTPDFAEAHFNLGNTYSALGQKEEAIVAYRAVLALSEAHFDASDNLGNLLLESGRRGEAQDVFKQALAQRKIPGDKLEYLARSLITQNFLAEAEVALRRYVETTATNAQAWQELFYVLHERQDFNALLHWAEKRLASQPDHAEALLAKAGALFKLCRYREAEAICEQALARLEVFPEAYNLLGAILCTTRRYDKALLAVERAIEQNPDYGQSYVTRGEIQRKLNQHFDAIASLRRATELIPRSHAAWVNLGNMESGISNFEEGLACYQRAIGIGQSCSLAASNRLFMLNYDPDISGATLFDEYTKWAAQNPPPYVLDKHANRPDPGRRLRLGYLSADFGNHVVARFVAQLIERHNSREFELVLYDNTDPRDPDTQRFRDWAEEWCDARALNDDQLAKQIVKDRIDILVDLSGHTSGNRLPVLARKPAPVQVSYLGYGYTTGLETVDYFLADRWFVPNGAECWFAEQIFRLPRSMYCYRPPETTPDVQGLPAARNGYVTFGSLSRPIRLNYKVIRLWSEILAAVPRSRLILDNFPFADPAVCQNFKDRFAAHGITPDRVIARYTAAYWPAYRDIDIVLDSFPHNAGTGTIEALWMGAPVLSLEDRPPLGRFGATILHALDMNGWLARSEEEYVAKAIAFSQNPDELGRLRAGLRARMERSPLRDEKGFVRAVEAAYRKMWKKWCAQQKK